ncbi:molybdopterin-binding protein [Aminomonas paucivorans]|uniref:Molybdopterin binding domain containing protein n=1 Tax=Aminomonas paucivorans DSM 12260 TaxID=584708 RepID=E3CXS8_9BACT|nr:molybdopterin binding domain containing protein [Aminomonas paucivorans DSM 12260]
MKTETLPVEQAVGRILSHDLTLIDPVGGFKGARFRRGHRIAQEDVPLLLRMGKSHIRFLMLDPEEVHEDEAALLLGRRVQGEGLELRGPEEGKCTLTATRPGLLHFRDEDVDFINQDPDWIFTTRANRTAVSLGTLTAAFRIGPLAVQREQVDRVLGVAPLSVLPWNPFPTALVTTGREIYEGLVQDAFLPKLQTKLVPYGAPLMGHTLCPDDASEIARAVAAWLDKGARIVLCTGGMSVDADDQTPRAIRSLCDRVVFRRVPLIPGANLMLAQKGEAFLVGVPASAVFAQRTSLDVLLDRLYAGTPPTGEEVRRWGRGGLCRSCDACSYPGCAFSARS